MDRQPISFDKSRALLKGQFANFVKIARFATELLTIQEFFILRNCEIFDFVL